MTTNIPFRAPERPIALVGLMGVGKTTIGRRIASRLKRPFVDADEAVAEAAGRSVPDIFSDFGEAAFRDGERRVISRLVEEKRPMVLALGGGAFVDPETRALLKKKAVTVWLKADLDTLMERVSRKPGQRPLLDDPDPRAVMARLMASREPAYAEADIAVDSETGSHDATVEKVLSALADLEAETR
ncbi:shikimate kinase [Maricaulaceae bacterium MS644]